MLHKGASLAFLVLAVVQVMALPYWMLQPNLYFGLRTADSESVYFGVSWGDGATTRSKYQCIADDNPMGWMQLDVENGWGSQEVADADSNVRLTFKFISNQEDLSWVVEIKGEPINASLPAQLSLYHHFVVETENGDLSARVDSPVASVYGTYPPGSRHAGRHWAGFWMEKRDGNFSLPLSYSEKDKVPFNVSLNLFFSSSRIAHLCIA